MEMAAVIQYVLTSAQSFGSQDYYNKSLMTILGLLVYYSVKMNRHRQNGLSFVPKKILGNTWVPREVRGGLKATTCKRVTTLLSLYSHRFLLLSVSFSQSLVFLGRLCLKPFQHILDIVGLSQAQL